MLVSLRGSFLACVLAPLAVAQAPTLDYPALLSRLTDVDWLWKPPAAGERCVQWSSYDRASHKGPGDPAAWYANGDCGQYLRVEEKGGGKEFVMVDAKGPGCVARIWSANPQGTLHFDVDGARVWSVDFAALCSGKVDGVPEPLAGMRSRGGNCYLPIPFAKSLVVSCTSGNCYYAFDVVMWASVTQTVSFTPQLLQVHGKRVQATATRSERDKLWLSSRGESSRRLPPGSLVRAIYVQFPSAPGDRDQAQSVRLKVREGDAVLVDVPVSAFFAGGPDSVVWSGWYLGVRKFGEPNESLRTGVCALPMPLPTGGVIEVVRDDGSEPADWFVSWASEVVPDMPKDALRFHASYHLAKGTPTRPFGDHLVLDAKGPGRFVGCSLLVRNPSRLWWGEGDEKFTVDGEAFPSWFGTGTEDYFGYAWCDPKPFQAPFHAQIECQGPANFGFTQLHRTHVLDSVPFQQSFRFELERWHWVEDIKMDYASVAYWYGAPGATSGLPPVPPAAERVLEKFPAPPVFVAENALEGEALRIVSCSGGVHVNQGMDFLEKVFSKDSQLWWRDGKVGDSLVLAVPVQEAGRYKVIVALCQADDYGIVQYSLAGTPLGAPIDGYAGRVRSTGPRELGIVELPAGEAQLRCEITGRNEKAKPHFMMGLDYLRLEKLP